MIKISRGCSLADPLHSAMFADRKQVFVDRLGWDVSVTDDRYEIDRFDTDGATYFVAADSKGGHAGSLRLLPTTEPHILDSLFAQLCDGPVPRGPSICEITRLCLPLPNAAERLRIRNQLITAMVDHCLTEGIASLTGVVRWSFLEQICAMGWRCAALGSSCRVDGILLGAFRIDLDAATPALLAAKGIYQVLPSAHPARRAA